MPSDSSETRRHLKSQPAGAPPPEQEQHLPCPRCDSTNTKFCYYNNYNFSQPRHFCKSCRRYWTHGGTLRDIPVGGGSRKNAKRCRTAASYSSSNLGLPATPVLITNQNRAVENGVSFTSLLSAPGPGLLALGGFGLGLGTGYEDVGFGRGVWPFPGVVDGGANGGSVLNNTWQLETSSDQGVGFMTGDCFSWPDLAISTPGNGVK